MTGNYVSLSSRNLIQISNEAITRAGFYIEIQLISLQFVLQTEESVSVTICFSRLLFLTKIQYIKSFEKKNILFVLIKKIANKYPPDSAMIKIWSLNRAVTVFAMTKYSNIFSSQWNASTFVFRSYFCCSPSGIPYMYINISKTLQFNDTFVCKKMRIIEKLNSLIVN